MTYIADLGRTRHFLWIAVSGGLPALDETIKLYIIVLAIGIFATGFGKIAIGITLLRIIGYTSTWQKAMVWAIVVLQMATCLVDFGVSVFRCGPPQNTWTISSWETATCIPSETQTKINIFANSCQVFADFAFSLLPVAMVLSLRMPIRRKIYLCVALGLTLVTGAAGIVKTYHAATMDHTDLSYAIYPSLVWFSTESMLIIVCGSVPSLHTLYEKFWKVPRANRSGGGGEPGDGSPYDNSKDSHTYVYSGQDGSQSTARIHKKSTNSQQGEEWSLATITAPADPERDAGVYQGGRPGQAL